MSSGFGLSPIAVPPGPSAGTQITMGQGGYTFPINLNEQMKETADRQAQTFAAGSAAQAQIQAAQAAAAAQKFASVQQAEASKYASNQQLAGITAGIQYKKDIFGRVFPVIQNTIAGMGAPSPTSASLPTGSVTNISQLGGGDYRSGGGGAYTPNLKPAADYGQFASSNNPLIGQIANMASNPLQAPDMPNAPNLPTYQLPQFQQANLLNPSDMPVISRDLLNQQVNAGRAQNQMQAATDIQKSVGGLAGRGVAPGSPLARSMTGQIQAGLLGANAASSMAAEQSAANLNAQYAQAMNQALIQQASSVYGAQAGATEGAYGANIGALQAMYGSQLGLLGSEYQSQASMRNAGLGALQGMYGQQLGYAGQMGSAELQRQSQLGAAELQRQAQLGSAQMAANANIYGTNMGYRQGVDVANIQRQWQQQNAILDSLSRFATA